jgi:hypothetical protein
MRRIPVLEEDGEEEHQQHRHAADQAELLGRFVTMALVIRSKR